MGYRQKCLKLISPTYYIWFIVPIPSLIGKLVFGEHVLISKPGDVLVESRGCMEENCYIQLCMYRILHALLNIKFYFLNTYLLSFQLALRRTRVDHNYSPHSAIAYSLGKSLISSRTMVSKTVPMYVELEAQDDRSKTSSLMSLGFPHSSVQQPQKCGT